MSDLLDTFRNIIQEDVAGRGLGADANANLLNALPNDFAQACQALVSVSNARVGIVTGFYIPHGRPPAAETDGPLGAIFLARALTDLGIGVVLASDRFCRLALETGVWFTGLRKQVPVVSLADPNEGLAPADYREHFFDRAGSLTHLIAIERVGPSYTPEALEQAGAEPTHRQAFEREVRPEDYNRCHTMRGLDITPHMSPAHYLFETAVDDDSRHPGTIAIGDGGNEIGMGKIPWWVIRQNIPGGAKVACRIPADHLIVSGISNWGAYGLAAGVYHLLGKTPPADLFDPEHERRILEMMVDRGPLVDGVSGEPETTVDGLEFDRYAEPLRQLAAFF
ncbi:MAG: hypothetical protein KatS3mg105_1988 [Gemmatales bacterium]|nr:MAG: hypothetical protein KatS3mg105_1988 [Gemmatales bacterium]